MTSTKDSSPAASAADAELDLRLARALTPRGEVLEAYLFGSRATGQAQAHSDIDVGHLGARLAGLCDVVERVLREKLQDLEELAALIDAHLAR